MQQLVLVINCGSSSLKFAVIDAISGEEALSGLAECFHLADARIKWQYQGNKQQSALATNASHRDALTFIVEQVLPASLTEQLVAVGHRVVHGGETYGRSIIIDEQVIAGIDACASLAPLHNPPALIGIRAAQQAFPLPQIAVFDTAFHQTMPPEAYAYALPQKLYRQHKIRRYGMHGTSHRFITEQTAKLLGKAVTETNLISCHLGNGASITAIREGQSVDTSMGMTPLEGLVMGTRCGDIDPALIFHLVDNLGYHLDEVKQMLNEQSGLLGLSEQTSDCRGILEGDERGHPGCTLALEVMCYRLAKYISAYLVPLKRIDALVFTGGIGENADLIRHRVLGHLDFLGYRVDEQRNQQARFGASGIISASGSPVAMVIPTNEEFVIAADALALIRQ